MYFHSTGLNTENQNCSMPDDGGVLLDVIVSVLRAHGVDISSQSLDDGNVHTTIMKSTIVEVQVFPPTVNRHMVNRLAHKFCIPVHHFYHPEVADGNTLH